MKNSFINQLRAKQASAQAVNSEPSPEPAEMSESELDAEVERARADLRRAKEQELAAAREAAQATPARPRFLPKRTPRRRWK